MERKTKTVSDHCLHVLIPTVLLFGTAMLSAFFANGACFATPAPCLHCVVVSAWWNTSTKQYVLAQDGGLCANWWLRRSASENGAKIAFRQFLRKHVQGFENASMPRDPSTNLSGRVAEAKTKPSVMHREKQDFPLYLYTKSSPNTLKIEISICQPV